jgi:hypothetical protein
VPLVDTIHSWRSARVICAGRIAASRSSPWAASKDHASSMMTRCGVYPCRDLGVGANARTREWFGRVRVGVAAALYSSTCGPRADSSTRATMSFQRSCASLPVCAVANTDTCGADMARSTATARSSVVLPDCRGTVTTTMG